MIQSPAGYQGDVRVKRYLDFYQAGYGVAMLSSGVAFSPLSLFAQGEQGGWYDPSDLTTLFQDAAGTTPVTAVEQPVGRVLDKSGRGNHLSQSTSTARPVLSARVNLLTYTEQFDNAAWTKAGTQVTADQTAAPNGTTTADKVNANASGAIAVLHSPLVTIGNIARTGSIYLKPGTWRYITFSLQVYSGTAQWVACTVDLNTGTITKTGAGAAGTYVSSSISAAANGFYLVTLTGVLPAGTDFAAAELSFANSATPSYGSYGRVNVTGTAADYFYVWGADLRSANAGVGLPSYQRVTTSTDYDTTGFPLYLKFDGTDDFLVSSTISPGSVDKAQVFAGVRKLSDAAISAIVETSTNASSTAGSLVVYSSVGAAGNFAFGLNGSSWGFGQANGFTAPLTNVLAAAFDIGGVSDTDEVAGRINSTAQSLVFSGDPGGTGNFTSQPVYVGARFGTTTRSLFFYGHLYSLILRFSATNMDAATIASTETWVNSKTGAY